MSMSLIRFLIGVFLIPVCITTSQILLAIASVPHSNTTSIISSHMLSLIGGYILWLIIYFSLPPPVRTYVLAHELTHALWGILMGAHVSTLAVGKTRGSVTLSKTNFIITLAPYFFPLYTVIVVAMYYLTSIFYNMSKYDLLWLSLIGFTWGFHFTFTICSLSQQQTDIQAYGRLFSYTIIYILNLLGIALWIVLVSSPTLQDFIGLIRYYFTQMWNIVYNYISNVFPV